MQHSTIEQWYPKRSDFSVYFAAFIRYKKFASFITEELRGMILVIMGIIYFNQNPKIG